MMKEGLFRRWRSSRIGLEGYFETGDTRVHIVHSVQLVPKFSDYSGTERAPEFSSKQKAGYDFRRNPLILKVVGRRGFEPLKA